MVFLFGRMSIWPLLHGGMGLNYWNFYRTVKSPCQNIGKTHRISLQLRYLQLFQRRQTSCWTMPGFAKTFVRNIKSNHCILAIFFEESDWQGSLGRRVRSVGKIFAPKSKRGREVKKYGRENKGQSSLMFWLLTVDLCLSWMFYQWLDGQGAGGLFTS